MKTLYIDMDGVLVDFQSGIDQLSEEVKNEYEDRLDEVPGIFGMMQPMKGALAAFEQLSGHYDTYILSTAPWENETAWHDKIVWVKKHLGEKARKRLILTHNKHLNKGHFLIDDRLKNGAEFFEGEHIHFRTDKFPNWEAVLEYLLNKA